jgi:hypothetical protein
VLSITYFWYRAGLLFTKGRVFIVQGVADIDFVRKFIKIMTHGQNSDINNKYFYAFL